VPWPERPPVVYGVDPGENNLIVAVLASAARLRGTGAGRRRPPGSRVRLTASGWASGLQRDRVNGLKRQWRAKLAAHDGRLAATSCKSASVAALDAYAVAAAAAAAATFAEVRHVRWAAAAFGMHLRRVQLFDSLFAELFAGSLRTGTRGVPPAVIGWGTGYGGPRSFLKLAALRAAAQHGSRAVIIDTHEKNTTACCGDCGHALQGVYSDKHGAAARAAHARAADRALASGGAPPPPLPPLRLLHDLLRCPHCGAFFHRDDKAAADIGTLAYAAAAGLPPPFVNARETTPKERADAGLVSRQRKFVLGQPGGLPAAPIGADAYGR
jgi:hypothetical protein